MKKNSQIHFNLDTHLHNKLRDEAEEKDLSLSQLIRQILRERTDIFRIERKIDHLAKRLFNN